MRRFMKIVDAILSILWQVLRVTLRLAALLLRIAVVVIAALVRLGRRFDGFDRFCERVEEFFCHGLVRDTAEEIEHQYRRLTAVLEVSPRARRWFFLVLLLLYILVRWTTNSWSYQGEGIASWYGPRFYGRKTASGEVLHNDRRLTAAHRSLPLGTKVLVINNLNGRQVTVKINDRGPYVDGRIIDLSREAAKRLDIVTCGIAPVTLYVRQ